MPVNFAALRGDAPAADHPADGLHVARLERAQLYDGDRGAQLITEWSDENNLMWTSWNRFDGPGLKYTQDLLDGLGIDRSQVTEETFGRELARAEGGTYQVRTKSREGRDKWFTDTYVEQPLEGRAQRSSEIPADTRGLPDEERAVAPGGAAADLFGDDDIPF